MAKLLDTEFDISSCAIELTVSNFTNHDDGYHTVSLEIRLISNYFDINETVHCIEEDFLLMTRKLSHSLNLPQASISMLEPGFEMYINKIDHEEYPDTYTLIFVLDAGEFGAQRISCNTGPALQIQITKAQIEQFVAQLCTEFTELKEQCSSRDGY
ncbi:hypothetical protein [Paenibacillus sp. 481]|uniref:hypothetical protein n=1 Tax=Paenibacillus sp. 481 TaxID=2835869 RepID=UPI001E50F840|nr:hypothetical protein [Paenibacillus sp. 481]UHA73845.1 hypothetical protein KIK04_01360 [Paenibacillus sp. 481]